MNSPLKIRLAEVLADSPVDFAFIFGSRTRGDHRADSDLDIAVMIDGEFSLLKKSRRLSTDFAPLDRRSHLFNH
jgi:predicted nucleotidyltransferase